jgi:tetratricopeptide (TPR) repeat protein
MQVGMARNTGRFRTAPRAALLLWLFARASGQSPADPVERAIGLYRAGDTRRACPMFRQLAARRPSNPALHLYLVGCAIRDKNDNAMAASRRALARTAPAPSPVHAVAGDWLATAGHCRAAEEEYALAPAPGTPGAVAFALAQCLQSTGDGQAAAERYRAAIAASPDKEEYRLSLAFLLIGTGGYDQAGKVLVDAAKRFPQSVRVLVTMSILHIELGYPERARIGYEKARALAPDSPLVWKLLGRIQNAEGAYAEAVTSFERAAAAEPGDAQIWLFMGLSQVRLEGGADKALADFLRALELDGGLLEARVQAAAIYIQSKQEYARAADELERVVAAAPGLARAHLLLVQAYQRLGLPEKAAAEARKYRELTQPPDSPGER